MNRLAMIFDNDSRLGRLMTRIGILCVANLLFVVFSIPVVTAGAAYAALYYTMLRVLRGDGEINPFREFWKGFRDNLGQATIAFLGLAVLIAVLLLELFWCEQFTGVMHLFYYLVLALLFLVAGVASYLFPTMSAFAAPLPTLITNSIFFAGKNPLRLLSVLFMNLVPLALTYAIPRLLPLFAFCWCFFGFAAIAMQNASTLLPLFKPYLPRVNACGDILEEGEEEEPAEGEQAPTDAQTLDDMRKLGM